MGIPMKRSVWTASLYLLPSLDMKIGNGALSKAHDKPGEVGEALELDKAGAHDPPRALLPRFWL